MIATLENKKILVGITGAIAAYKAAELVRLLVKQKARIKVVMTSSACQFITPLTLQALSGNPVSTQLLDPETEAGMGHIEFAKWADLILIAPATANFMARLTQGMSNDLLSTLCLASSAPIHLAPAMNQFMWQNPATQANVKQLKLRNIRLLGPAKGEQACGDNGPGRMLEPEQLVQHCEAFFAPKPLSNVCIMITAGPTQEMLDPVRYISNYSSGKMGFALADAAQKAGAKVILVSGPVHLPTPVNVERIDVKSALQMQDCVHQHLDQVDIFIGCAAVADFRPINPAEKKTKKGHDIKQDKMLCELIRNPDILASVSASKNCTLTVGFAAETHNLLEYAREKIQRKNLDLIVANDISNPSIGFNSDNNAVTVINCDKSLHLEQQPKTQLAAKLIELITEQFAKKNHDTNTENSDSR